jgi:hypothetical protein
MVGFILMVSGGQEKETFWVFNALLQKRKEVPDMDGLRGFYKLGFPLWHKYCHVFNMFFKEILPQLYERFQSESIME